MAPRLRWQDEIGRQTLACTVKVLPVRTVSYPSVFTTTSATEGLRPVQADLVSAILNGDDVLCCTATGDAKSAAFSVPILVLTKYNAHPDLYPAGLPTRVGPISIIVIPTTAMKQLHVFNAPPSAIELPILTPPPKARIRSSSLGTIAKCTQHTDSLYDAITKIQDKVNRRREWVQEERNRKARERWGQQNGRQ
ncbi:hypothetical protein C8R44DRAFT_850962 [Mycena epipterygia]|nr:hypothetical protein C8R44DRAFT_850962 [Mycena epipterygia]